MLAGIKKKKAVKAAVVEKHDKIASYVCILNFFVILNYINTLFHIKYLICYLIF